MVFWANLRRLVHLVAVIARHAVAQMAGALLARSPGLAQRVGFEHFSGPKRLRMALEDLGGTFIKFGQMLALQPDILSLDYCNELFDLLDRCSPFAYSEVEKIFLAEIGKTPAEIFDAFETQPLATASIGQVHVGYLRGRKVAIKVQRPNADTDFAGDIRLMLAILRLIKHLRLKFLYWMIEPISEFVGWTREELDYRCEARYIEQLRRNARDNRKEIVPEVTREYSTRRILVTEFLEGQTLLSYLRMQETGDEIELARLKSAGFDAHQLARHVIDNFLGDAFQHGLFHADLHPANLMILPGNVVGYVDFGITGVISQYSRQNLTTMTLAYTRGDLDGMCEAFFRVSAIDRQSDIPKFRKGVKRLSDNWYESSGKRRRLRKNFTLVMLDMLRLSHATNIWPERDVIKYIRSSIAIDGLITRFAPGFDLGRHLEAVCDSYLKWQVRKSLFAYNTLVGWARSSEHLMRDGAWRVNSFLRRMATGELPIGVDADRETSDDDKGWQSSTIQLGIAIFAITVIIAITGGRAGRWINLFTAGVALITCATMMLLRNARGVPHSR